MITLIQRVTSAKVTIENKVTGNIKNGLLLYIGFEDGDNLEKIKWSINKIINLRIFADKEDKMNLSLLDIKGVGAYRDTPLLLVISNFTLPADLNESGRRPSFTKSASPEIAENLYNQFIDECKNQNINVAQGKFGAMMDIESVNDGPVNFILKR
ncbi:MAG: D-tyrosyl-tRNA(Tyr) deacylase [Candidatus Melainabacteria bacterium RIFCSPHIGHO2_02_FULL_34_12]|nr:MAG: D-tyrosyl-tRNA(Tyr) deacylase [Candidatus Melainabacteria bacterium RIFCSPHIGHO2_02_FULL_34_12]